MSAPCVRMVSVRDAFSAAETSWLRAPEPALVKRERRWRGWRSDILNVMVADEDELISESGRGT